MMQTSVMHYGLVLLFFCGCVSSFIVPEELPTILSLIYSNIPPVKKGTDSRVGVGFRLGEHADFQILVELGPQRETDPIGNTDSKKRRQASLNAAMKGDYGPWAQSVAKFQTQRRIQNEIEQQTRLREKLLKLRVNENVKSDDGTSVPGEWLTKWSKGMVETPDQQPVDDNLPIRNILPGITTNQIHTPVRISSEGSLVNDKMKNLQKLYEVQSSAENR